MNAKLDEVRADACTRDYGQGRCVPDLQLSGRRCAADQAGASSWIAKIPILFLDTGYHFAETYAYRDRIAREWSLNLINLLPEKTVAEQEAELGLLYQSAPDQCCKLRKVEPLFKAVAEYRVWLTGLAARTGAEPRGAGRVGAVRAARRQAGAEACAAGRVDDARCLVRLRTTFDSAAAAL